MAKLPEGKTRLDLVKEGLTGADAGWKKQGRLVVSIERLREDPRNERRTFRNMEGLIASVKAVGLIEPITVTSEEGKEGVYRIVTGHRRYRAAKAAGIAQVEILIREPDDELTRRVKSIISNIQREDVGPVEMAEALQGLMDEDQRVKTQDDLARLIGKQKSWVSGMLNILALSTDLRRKVQTSELSISYDSIMNIARIGDRKAQKELIDAVLSGVSNRDIRQRIGEMKGKGGHKSDSASSTSTPKPKKVYYTKYKATVIVQSQTSRLTSDQVMEALQDAMGQAAKGE
jgi:ParB family chromosome partitioning protein